MLIYNTLFMAKGFKAFLSVIAAHATAANAAKAHSACCQMDNRIVDAAAAKGYISEESLRKGFIPVSYTHLTLPTTREE